MKNQMKYVDIKSNQFIDLFQSFFTTYMIYSNVTLQLSLLLHQRQNNHYQHKACHNVLHIYDLGHVSSPRFKIQELKGWNDMEIVKKNLD